MATKLRHQVLSQHHRVLENDLKNLSDSVDEVAGTKAAGRSTNHATLE